MLEGEGIGALIGKGCVECVKGGCRISWKSSSVDLR